MAKQEDGKTTNFRSLTVTIAIAFMAVSAVVLFISSALDMYINVKNQRKIVVSQQRLMAQNAADKVGGVIQEKYRILKVAVNVGDLAVAGEENQKLVIEKLIGIEPSFRRLTLFDPGENKILGISRVSGEVKIDLNERDSNELFSRSRSGNIYCSSVYVDGSTFEPFVIMAVPVKNVFGDFKGTLTAEVNLKFMWDLVGGMRFGNKGLSYVVDRKGDLIAFRDVSRILKGENLAHLDEVRAFVKGDETSLEGTAAISKGILGSYVVANYVRLAMPDWAVMVELPVQEAYRTVIVSFAASVLVLLASFILAIVSGFYLSKRITKPIIDLRDGARRVGKGERKEVITVRPNNEIGELADSFNQMVLDLNNTTVSMEELRKEQKRFKDVALSMADFIWEVDDKGVYTYCSEKVKDILGYDQQELIGKTPFDLMPPEEAARVGVIFSRIVLNKEMIRDLENWNLAKDGRKICLLTNGVPLLDEKGGFKGYRGVDKNITSQKLAEEEKQRLQEKLIHSEKIAAVGQLAGGVAHEINNPLGVILGFAQHVCRQLKEGDPLYLPLKSIEREALRCKKLILDLLTFSRTGKIVPEMVDVDAAVEETLLIVETQAKMKKVEIVKKYGKEVPKVLAVKDKLQQVLFNLCNNAIDAMPDGGTLTIETAELSSKVVINISDTGEGMTEETQKHIFEPFFTTKEVGKGTGLGLSLSYEMILNQQGTLEFTSEPGGGTVFTIKLPLR